MSDQVRRFEPPAMTVERRVFHILGGHPQALSKRQRELLPFMRDVLNDLLADNPRAVSFEIRVAEEGE